MGIAENLKLDPRFSALKMAVEAAGLMDTVENDGPFTLFAPIDEAFDKLAGKTLGKKEATQIVNKHLVKGTIYSLGLIGHTYETLSGATINTEKNEEENYVVTEGDHTATPSTKSFESRNTSLGIVHNHSSQNHISQTILCANESSKNRVNRTDRLSLKLRVT